MKTLSALLMLMLMVGVAEAQWEAETPMNVARHGLDAVEHNGDVYVVGGWNGPTTLERFSDGEWSYMAPLPEGQAGICAALVGDEIYTIGDYGFDPTVQIYDINTDSWSAGPDLPNGLYWATSEAIGNTIYVIGGHGSPDTVFILDTMTGTWNLGIPCPVPMFIITSVVLDGYIYVFSFNGDFRYDPANDSWESIANRTHLTAGATAEVVDGMIYVMGGNYGFIYEAFPYTQIYDPDTDTWSDGPDMIMGRYQLTSAYIDDYIYTIGGHAATGISQNWVEKLYVPTSPAPVELSLWPQTNIIPPEGGTLEFDANVVSNLPNTIPGVWFWTRVKLPNDTFYPQNLFQLQFTLTPYMDVTGSLTQNIPGYAPAGDYELWGWVGLNPNSQIRVGDFFPFSKSSTFAGGAEVSDWVADGEFNPDQVTDVERSLPTMYEMQPATPNPFNPTATVSITLPEMADLTVAVFNVMGQQVAQLADGQFNAGVQTFSIDGSALASGLYFIQAQVPGKLNQLQKITLIK